MRRVLVGVLLPMLVATPARAQLRFPGDSPTRPAVMKGRVLGDPQPIPPKVPTFTIPQGGYAYPDCWYSSGYCPGYRYYWEATQARYNYPTYYVYPAVQRVDYRALYGLPGPQSLQAGGSPIDRPRNPVADELPPAPQEPQGSRPTQLKRAWRYVDLGDRYLREGRLLDARRRYRKAAAAAPDLAAVAVRQMFLELAQGNLHTATERLTQAMALDPHWPEEGFRLEVVYSPEMLQQVRGQLNQHLVQFPNDADAQLLAGMLAHAEGQADKSQQHFQQAHRLTDGLSVARLFLPKANAVGDAK